MIIHNVKIYTMAGDGDSGVIGRGYVRTEGSLIAEVGCGDPPAGYIETLGGEVIDGGAFGDNCCLLPGFIDGHTHLGIIGDSLGFEGDDVNEMTDPVTPQLRALDAVNPFDRCVSEAARAGITCVAVSPGSANTVGGQIYIYKTRGGIIDSMLLGSAPAAMKFALGENPKGVYHGKSQSPETRMAIAAHIREALLKARKYSSAMEKYEESLNKQGEDKSADGAADGEDDILDEPEFDFKCHALLPVVRGEIPAHFHAHRADDIATALRIADEFNLKYVLVHCTEGHLIADELAKRGARVFSGPNLCDRSKPELRELTYGSPAALDAAGVSVALTTDHPVIPVPHLPLCASLAVKSGMDGYNAIKAITINPAKILGIDNRVGSIEPGKDADFVLFDGNPLEVASGVRAVFINGERI